MYWNAETYQVHSRCAKKKLPTESKARKSQGEKCRHLPVTKVVFENHKITKTNIRFRIIIPGMILYVPVSGSVS